VEPSTSSFAARSAVIRLLSSPRSSSFLYYRWLLTHLPSHGSSAQRLGTLHSS
jgi:hypothetical protein